MAREVDLNKAEEVYILTGKCGQVIDTTDSRQAAVKSYIQDKARGADVTLKLRRGGKLYAVHPSGTMADYH